MEIMSDDIMIIQTRAPEPSRCPECERIENIKRTCRHCGYEYKNAPTSGWEILVVVLILVFSILTIWTLAGWFMESDTKSLLDVINDQCAWVLHLRIW